MPIDDLPHKNGKNRLRERSLAVVYTVEPDAHRQDFLIDLAFGLGVVLLVVPDTFFYSDSIYSLKYWLNIANTGLDFLLFTTVFVFVKKEIRKRRALNEQLAAANRLKTEFLQIAAHDLRKPLNAISLIASDLPATEKDGESNPGEEIRSSAHEMLLIIDGLLDAAALESSTLQLNRVHLDLADCISDVVESNRRLAKYKNQQLVFSVRERCLAKVDGVRIKQAVDNLVSNAIKFSPMGESISVTLECEGDKARIEVADRGPGLTEADKERLFRRFERLSARPTGGESSTGIGLANARQLVELHGGTIGVESKGPGQGSRFWITLPIQT